MSTATPEPALSPRDVAGLLEKAFSEKTNAYIAGGQALNFWASMFSGRTSDLAQYAPYVSKDIDFFGFFEDAAIIAAALGADIERPSLEDNSPNTAVLLINAGGYKLVIDFIGSILGAQLKHVEDFGSLEVEFPIADESMQTTGEVVTIPVMHPLVCLESRVGNVVTLRRAGALSMRQLQASVIVLREYIALSLEDDHPEAMRCIAGLFEYARSSIEARILHERHSIDIMDALKGIADHPRLDPRYRDKTLAPMIEKIKSKRRGPN
ncbi:MAG: hypothetical protein OEZ03_17585 [Alphaproteobacteria bacterium]|nr:hypothetical protein [Alphaproteobacteria bacterium]